MTISKHAAAAKAIRADLKKAFPKTKFSVTSESYSMGNSVWVRWVDGPTRESVHKIACKYQEGHFDGMDDSYVLSNLNPSLPQVKFVQLQRRSLNHVE